MPSFINIRNIYGNRTNLCIPSTEEFIIDANGLTVLPAPIDPHVHFRTPGSEHKENWISGAKAAIYGGITTVFDMPNNHPACTTKGDLLSKIDQIKKQLIEADIPLRFHLYFGVDRNHLDEIPKVKNHVIGLKIFMGSSTGNLLIDDDETLEKAFKLAAENDLLIAVHAEEEEIIKKNLHLFSDRSDPSIHSKIRSPEAAEKSVCKAIALCEKYGTRLYILHMSTEREVELVRQAKRRSVPVFAETTPHHLFLSIDDYDQWGAYVKMNPPLRTKKDQEALWKGIHDGTIDTIGSDHAPHTHEEKKMPYEKCPSGVPGVETLLPLLLNAHNAKRISLEKIVALTRTNIQKIFDLEDHPDYVLVDLNQSRTLNAEQLKSKCGWSPFVGCTLKGWPVYTIVGNRFYHVV